MKIDNCYENNFERNFLILTVILAFFAICFWAIIIFDIHIYLEKEMEEKQTEQTLRWIFTKETELPYNTENMEQYSIFLEEWILNRI